MEESRKASLLAKRAAMETPPSGGFPSVESGGDALLEPSTHDVRIAQAKARREKAEADRKAALQHRMSAGSPGMPGPCADVSDAPQAEEYGSYEGVSDPSLLEPSAHDTRGMIARERREKAEAERKAALLQKRAAKAKPTEGGGGGPSNEIARLEAAVDAAESEAAKVGLKKQLAAQRAILVREQRKREQAEREARRAAQEAAARAAQQAREQEEEQIE